MSDKALAEKQKGGLKKKVVAFAASVQRGAWLGVTGALNAVKDPAVRKQLVISMGPLLAGSVAWWILAPMAAKKADWILETLVKLPILRKLPFPKDFDLTERVKSASFATFGLSFVRQVFSGPLDKLFFANVPKPNAKGFESYTSEISRVSALSTIEQKVPVPKAIGQYAFRQAKTQLINFLAHLAIGVKAIKKFVAPVLGAFYLYKTGDWLLVLLAIPISFLPFVGLVGAFTGLMGLRSMSRELFEPLVLRDESINKKELFSKNALTMAAFTLPFFLTQYVPGLDALGFGLAQAAAAPLASMMLSQGGVDQYVSVMKKTD